MSFITQYCLEYYTKVEKDTMKFCARAIISFLFLFLHIAILLWYFVKWKEDCKHETDLLHTKQHQPISGTVKYVQNGLYLQENM